MVNRVFPRLPRPQARAALTAIALLVCLVLMVLILVAINAGFLDQDDLMGMTPEEVRAECGEPDAVFDYRNRPGVNELQWDYGHWLPGCYSTVRFKDDVVVSVSQVSK